MDLNVALKRIIDNGKIDFGSEKTVKNLMAGKAKLVIVSSNCPRKTRTMIEERARLEEIPLIAYRGTSLQLGEACGKPFLIASLTVLDAGGTDIGELKA